MIGALVSLLSLQMTTNLVAAGVIAKTQTITAAIAASSLVSVNINQEPTFAPQSVSLTLV
jgi:hypothetical protein